MKKLIFLVVLFLMSFSVIGEAQSSELDFFKEIFQMEKKAVTAEYMALSGEAEAAFWPVYNAYEAERRILGQRRINLLENYAEKYDKLTDDQASVLVKENLAIQKKSLALKKKYFKKMSKAIGASKATSFYQLEEYIRVAIQYEILDALPFVNE